MRSFALVHSVRGSRERLALEKQIADAKLKLMDAQMGELRRKLTSGEAFREIVNEQALIPTPRAGTALDLNVNPEAAGIMPPETLGPPGSAPMTPERKRRLMGAMIDFAPGEVARGLLQPAPMPLDEQLRLLEASPLFRNMMGGGAGGPAQAPSDMGVVGQTATPLTEVPEPQAGGVIAQVPPPQAGAPLAQAQVPAPAPGPRILPVPSFRLTKDGIQVTIGGQLSNFDAQQSNQFDPATGQNVIVREWIDRTTGRVIPQSRSIVGLAPAPEAMQRFRDQARGLGLTPGTVQHEFVATQLALIDAIPDPREKRAALQELQQQIQGGGVRGVDIGRAAETARREKLGDIEAETRAREAAQRLAGKLSDQDRQALQTQTAILANLRYLENTFSEEEIKAFVGLLNRPMQEAQLIASGIFGTGGSERFAEFKAANERMRATAFGEGGKQLTALEASVVFGFTPTGREAGGATEYLAKVRNLKVFTQMARELRLELGRKGAGEIDVEDFDKKLADRMKAAGISRPKPPETKGKADPNLTSLMLRMANEIAKQEHGKAFGSLPEAEARKIWERVKKQMESR